MLMVKNYKRRRVRSLDDLELEQLRLRKKLNHIEQDWLNILNPQQLALNWAMNLVSNKLLNNTNSAKSSKSAAPNLFKFANNKRKTQNKQTLSATAANTETSKTNKTGNTIRKVIQWQLLGVGILLVSNFLKRKKLRKTQ